MICSDLAPELSRLRPTGHAQIILKDERNGSKNACLSPEDDVVLPRKVNFTTLVLWRTLPISSSLKLALS
jgi:hypothetical protein